MRDLQNTNPPWWVRITWMAGLLLFINLVLAGDGDTQEITVVGDNFVLQADVLEVQEGPKGVIIFIGKDEQPTDIPDEPNDSSMFDCNKPDFGPPNPARKVFCNGN